MPGLGKQNKEHKEHKPNDTKMSILELLNPAPRTKSKSPLTKHKGGSKQRKTMRRKTMRRSKK
jgi:hypothetical protein